MHRTLGSFTRFRQLSAPRIRTAARLDDSPDRHRNFSATNIHKFSPGANNPESSRPITKKAPSKPELAKMASAQYTRDTFRVGAESPVKMMAENPPPATRKQVQYGKQYGRKLEYPVNRPEQRVQKPLLEQTPPQRPFTSSHYPSRSVKSDRIKAEKAEYDMKFQKALDYLLETNPEFIKERQRLCCQKAKPHETRWKIPQAGVISTYKEHYPPKWAHLDHDFHPEPRNKMQAFTLPDGNLPKNSTYKDHYDGKHGDPANLAEWPEGFKLQGPIADSTTYGNHFPNYGNYDKMVPFVAWDKAPTGLPFSGNSNHRVSYKDPKGAPSAQLATWNNLHPYGNEFDPNRGTTYSDYHGPKERQPIQDFKVPYEQILKSPGKFGTEYGAEYKDKTNQPVNKSNKCPC